MALRTDSLVALVACWGGAGSGSAVLCVTIEIQQEARLDEPHQGLWGMSVWRVQLSWSHAESTSVSPFHGSVHIWNEWHGDLRKNRPQIKGAINLTGSLKEGTNKYPMQRKITYVRHFPRTNEGWFLPSLTSVTHMGISITVSSSPSAIHKATGKSELVGDTSKPSVRVCSKAYLNKESVVPQM